MKQTVFIAGSESFIGRGIAAAFARHAGYRLVTGSFDYRSPAAMNSFFRKHRPRYVVSCAVDTGGAGYLSFHEAEVFLNNTLANLNLNEAARAYGAKKIINLLSNGSYPVSRGMLCEERFWNGPPDPAAFSIGAVSRHAIANSIVFHAQYGLSYTNLVVGSPYGPDTRFDGSRSYALNAIVRKVTDAKKRGLSKVVLWGTGKPIRDWTYIDDLGDAVMCALRADTGTEPINIGSGDGISIARLAAIVKQTVHYAGRIEFDSSRPDGAMRKVMAVGRAKSILGWHAKTSLAEGIARTAESFDLS